MDTLSEASCPDVESKPYEIVIDFEIVIIVMFNVLILLLNLILNDTIC